MDHGCKAGHLLEKCLLYQMVYDSNFPLDSIDVHMDNHVLLLANHLCSDQVSWPEVREDLELN